MDKTSYTYSRRPVKLIYKETFQNPNDAITWEKRIKGWSRKKKEALIKGDFEELKKLSNNKNESGHTSRSSVWQKTTNKDHVVDHVVENVVDNRLIKIINLIKNNNQISANKIAKLLGVTSRTAQRDLEKLTKQKRIKRKGSERGGYWEIINE